MSDNKIDFQIVEFEQKYQDQVIEVVGKVLVELKVIPESDEPLQDDRYPLKCTQFLYN